MNLGTPALLFGSISLIMLAYTNRFLVLAKLIRDLHHDSSKDSIELAKQQLPILRTRVRLIQAMQALGVLAFLFCTVSMFSIFLNMEWLGNMLFGVSVVSLMTSLLFSLWEVLVSTKALDLVLNDFDKKNCS